MAFVYKMLSRSFGVLLQIAGLAGSFIPTPVQEGAANNILSLLASPYVYVPCILIGTIITTIAYGSLWAEHKIKTAGGITKREFPARLKRWDRVHEFLASQAAWLWNGLEPQEGRTQGTPAYPTLRSLREYFQTRPTKDDSKDDEEWASTALTRQQLVDCSLAWGERPTFLFRHEQGLIGRMRRIICKILGRYADPQEIHSYHSNTLSNLEMAAIHLADENKIPSTPDPSTQAFDWLSLRLKSGAIKAIGRRQINGLAFDYERLSRRDWNYLVLSRFSNIAEGRGLKFVDILFSPLTDQN